MKKIYVVHPLRGDLRNNEERIARICRNIADTVKDVVPLSPVLAFNFFDPDREPVKAMQYCLELLACCDEAWVYGDWEKSEGCCAEVSFAKCRNILVCDMRT